MILKRSLLAVTVLAGCADAATEREALQLQHDDVGTDAGAETTRIIDASVGIVTPCGPTSIDSGIARPGEGCAYVKSEGTAVIESIESVGADVAACERDPVRVRFRFEPDDAEAAARGALTDTRQGTLTIPGGMAPPRSCITAAGIQVNSRVRVQRASLVRGACSPVVFTFDEALMAACSKDCRSTP